MTRKRILNVTSIKKHDNMPPVVRSTPGGTPTIGPISMGAGTAFLFMPSARAYSTGDVGEAHRQRQTIYARGYKEKIHMTMVGGGAWNWRRIVFTFKGANLYGDSGAQIPYLDSGTGTAGNMARLIAPLVGTQFVTIRAFLFDGNEGIDWFNQQTAKVDTTRVSVISDTNTSLISNNESGRQWNKNCWYPINKNLVYDDDEDGPNTDVNYVSTHAKPGCGDVYVFDAFNLEVPSAAGGPTSVLNFTPEGTFYWHEK